MNILITGGTGFLGKRLALNLKEKGNNVYVIGRNKIIGSKLEDNKINFIYGDLTDKELILKSSKDMDYIFHSGALSSPWGKYRDFYNSNVVGTKNIILGSKENNIKRLIHVSTPSIYFNNQDRFNISETETLPETFANYYATTKKMAEDEIDKAHLDGLPVVTIRPRALFGPNDTSILPRLIKANGKFGVPIIDGGKAKVDITYIDNVVHSLILAMTSPSYTLGKKYNITNNQPMELIKLLELLFSQLQVQFNKRHISFKKAYRLASFLEFTHKYFLFGKEPVLTKYTVSLLASSQTLDITKARKELGYEPIFSIEEGLDYFVYWWRKENY